MSTELSARGVSNAWGQDSPICVAGTKELAKAIAITPELADVLEQALPYLREAAKADGHANGTYQLASKLLKKWSRYNV